MRIAYLVSRFPKTSETFIVRELDSVDAVDGVEVVMLGSLFAGDAPIHPAATRWQERALRPHPAAALRDLTWWITHRPVRLLSTVARVVGATATNPNIAIRSLATVGLACAHARNVRARGVEQVHAHFATYPALAAWVIERLTGVGYTVTVHAHDIFVDQRLMRLTLPGSRAAVAIAAYNRDFVVDELGAAAPPTEVIHCGVDPGVYEYRPRAVPSQGPIRALCVAALEPYKGHEVLLRALAGDAAGLERVHLELIGQGPLREQLIALTEDLGLSDRVRFRGPLSEEDVREELAKADLFVLASRIDRKNRMDGLPVALIEAVAAGVPTVSTRIAAIEELLGDGVGTLAEPDNVGSLAEALARACDATTPRAQDEGRSLVEREFSIDLSAVRLARLFGERHGADAEPAP